MKNFRAAQSAMRAKIAQDRELDKGNFSQALGIRTSQLPTNNNLPRPAVVHKDGQREWRFGY